MSPQPPHVPLAAFDPSRARMSNSVGERPCKLHEQAEARGWSRTRAWEDLYGGPPPDDDEHQAVARFQRERVQRHQATMYYGDIRE